MVPTAADVCNKTGRAVGDLTVVYGLPLVKYKYTSSLKYLALYPSIEQNIKDIFAVFLRIL